MAELPSRFGPYQIVSPLGAGGMGQVYRARDTRLQRFVAIKILHDQAALDPDRQRRFAQEAVAASALNHPNILTVYDVGADGDTQYVVSELIEGESLRTEMNHGRLPLKHVVEVAHTNVPGQRCSRMSAFDTARGRRSMRSARRSKAFGETRISVPRDHNWRASESNVRSSNSRRTASDPLVL
jgi:serine/threonine protein kinase